MWRALTLLVVVSAQECMKYKCYSGSEPVPNDTCGWVDSADSKLINLQLCSDDTNVYCDVPSTASSKNTTCTSYQTPDRKQGNPGDLCDVDAECVGASYCSSRVCTGFPLGAHCTSHNQCDAGLYCDVTEKCQAQKYSGDECTSDEECRNSLGCDKAINEIYGVCVNYYSLGVGAKVKQCILDVTEYKNNLCVTGVCEPDVPGVFGSGTCGQTYTSTMSPSQSLPIACTSDKDCIGYGSSDSSQTKHGKCSCGMNKSGQKYCELWSGDSAAAQVRDILKRHIIADYTFFCHTESRWDEACFTRTLTSGSVLSLIANKMLVENYPRISVSEACVQSIYMRKYSLINSNLYTCSSYRCSDKTNSCISYVAKDNTFVVNGCGADQMSTSECDFSLSQKDEWDDVECADSLPMSLSYPGESCKVSSDCTSSKCVKNVCVGLASGEECNIVNPYQCDVGLFCQKNVDDTICQPLQTEGETCTHDWECENSLGCYWDSHTAAGVCKQYFTVPIKTAVPCPLTGEQPLCTTAWCNQSDHDLGICVDAPKSIKNSPFSCTIDSDCRVKNSVTDSNYSRCRCSYSTIPGSYCDLFPGDDVGVQHFKTLKSYVKSGALKKCQTGRRFAPQCLDLAALSSGSNASYNSTVLLHMNYGAFGLYLNNPDCVKEVFARDYWSHYEDKDNDDNDDDDWSLKIVVSMGLLVVLL